MSNIFLLLWISFFFLIVLQELCRKIVESGAWFCPQFCLCPRAASPVLCQEVIQFYLEQNWAAALFRLNLLVICPAPNQFPQYCCCLPLNSTLTAPESKNQENGWNYIIFFCLTAPPPLMLSQQDSERGRWMYCVVFLMYVFLGHLVMYSLSATDPFFSALLCGGAGFYRLHFSLANGLDVRPCQQRALETHSNSGRERGDFCLFWCFVFLLSGQWLCMQGSWQCCLEVVLWSGSKHSPTHVHTGSPEVWISVSSLFPFPSALRTVFPLCNH